MAVYDTFKWTPCQIEAVTWNIQKDELSISDIRKVFDALTSLDAFEIVNLGADHLGIGPRIVHISLFEPGIGKMYKAKFSQLDFSSEERRTVSCFQIDGDDTS